MQQPPSNRRAGCVMWLAIIAIVMSFISLMSSVAQELAWNRRMEEFSALAISSSAVNAQAVNAQEVSQAIDIQEPTATLPAVIIEPSSSSPTNTPLPIPTSTPLPIPTSTPVPVPVGITYEQICDVDESNMTDPQLEAHATQFANQAFHRWHGWVYDVVSRADGSYNLEIAMEERGLFWSRNIVVENIPADLAVQLNVEQSLVFDGRVARVDYMFETMCNPMVVDNFILRE